MEHLLLNSCSNIVQFIRKQSILKKIFFSVSFHLFIKCLLPVFSLSIVCTMKQGRGGCLPPIGLSIYFLCLQRHRSREQGSGPDARWPDDKHRMQDGPEHRSTGRQEQEQGAQEQEQNAKKLQ